MSVEGSDLLISVIIPVYNVKAYLAEALDSVLGQSYPNTEILLIDDGSTDGSGELCDAYQQKDPRVKVIHQENKGLSGARNTGLDIMKGEIVAFLDPDDAYLPDFLASMTEIMIREEAEIVECRYTVHETNGRMVPTGRERRWLSAKEGRYDRIAALRALAEDRINIPVWNKLYRRELWREVRFPEGHVYEDIDTTYRVFDLCRTVYVTDRALCLYRRHPGSISKTYTLQNIRDRNLAHSHFYAFLEANIPEVFSAGRVKRDRSLAVLIDYYARCSAETTDPALATKADVKEMILAEAERLGIGSCRLRTRAAYRMICRCPALFSMLYAAYRPLRVSIKQLSGK